MAMFTLVNGVIISKMVKGNMSLKTVRSMLVAGRIIFSMVLVKKLWPIKQFILESTLKETSMVKAS